MAFGLLRCEDWAGLLWSATKGTIWFDGPALAKTRLEEKVRAAFSGGIAAGHDDSSSGEKVLVVFGQDRGTRDELKYVLRRLKVLEPSVLQLNDLIEVLKRERRRGGQRVFAFVLITSDEGL